MRVAKKLIKSLEEKRVFFVTSEFDDEAKKTAVFAELDLSVEK